MKWSILFVCLGIAIAKDCLEELEKSNASGLLGRFVPKCNPDGTYQGMQCHEAECYCVFPDNGREILGTRKHVPIHKPLKCAITDCVKKRHQTLAWIKIGMLLPFSPRCNEDGSYYKYQCFKGNMCWCADPVTGAGRDKAKVGLQEEEC